MNGARPSLADLDHRYDLVVIGGGITGAGVLREAVRSGARVLLVDQRDYASGTSSWSSKLVHGGLRYLRSGQWRLTLESVRERERLLREAPGLVQPLPFLMPLYRGRKPGRLLMQIGLGLYDLMAGSRKSRFVRPQVVLDAAPGIASDGLRGALAYEDAGTDDARLVLCLLFDALAQGAHAINYVRGECIAPGHVRLIDQRDGGTREIEAAMVVNATGAWPAAMPGAPTLRPLRGSHFVFARARLPLATAITWPHPRDGRPMFALPWQGAVVFGTTDLDHDAAVDAPRMSAAEATYLLDALQAIFPALALRAADALSSYSGVRPVVAGGKDAPSAESRESAIWSTPGCVGVTGGKLTTFRVTALQVLREAAKQVAHLMPKDEGPLFDATITLPDPAATDAVAGTPFTWTLLRHAAAHEHVVQLADLLLRRTRLGLLLPRGGEALMPELRRQCQSVLGWDDARWLQEQRDYLDHWQRQHAPEPA